MRPVSGGTDTHLALIDLRPASDDSGSAASGVARRTRAVASDPDAGTVVTGRDAEQRCDRARITLNKNAIPYDPQRPMVASGIRVGTPSVTTQGMREPEMHHIAALIARAVAADPHLESGRGDLADVADEVADLVAKFPAYPH
jgi:glycine hydroxymethyltransferase